METRAQLRQSEKLAALGTLSAGLAHELRNPLNTVSMLLYAVRQEMSVADRFRPDVEVMQGELQRMSLLIEQFLEFARPRPPHCQRERIHEIMEETLLLLGPEARSRGIRVSKEWTKDLPLVWLMASRSNKSFSTCY